MLGHRSVAAQVLVAGPLTNPGQVQSRPAAAALLTVLPGLLE